MLSVLRLTTKIVAFWTLFLTATIGVTRAFNPNRSPILDLLFRRTDGSLCQTLCLFSIQPGITTRFQAVQILQTHGDMTNTEIYDNNSWYFSGSWIGQRALFDKHIWVQMYFGNKGVVTQISVQFTDLRVEEKGNGSPVVPISVLGDMINYFGAPRLADRDADHFAIFADSITGQVFREDSFGRRYRPRPFDRLLRLVVESDNGLLVSKGWCGFTARLCE